jgi:hypothetical protein
MRDHTAQVFEKLRYFDKYTSDNEITAAETAALVTPTNYTIPNHLSTGFVLPERYGGGGDNSTLNDTAHANALKVANAMVDGTVQYGGGSAGVWKFAAPITIGGTGQGRRVVGVGRVEFNFAAGISNTLDLVTVYADVAGGVYADQPQFDNVQIACNSGGRDGVVLKGGNRPLLRNLRINNAGRDGYVESVTAPDWIEKADVSVLVRFAGRNGFRQELLGAAASNPFINEGVYHFEVRGVSAITAGGAALKLTGSAGLGGAAKISDNVYRTIFDAIYNTAATVPATSPVVLDTVVVQNATFIVPAWENTGSGGNPGAGPLIKVTSGTWGGLNLLFPNWNSFWGDGTVDAAILAVNRLDYSFPGTNTLYGKMALVGNVDGQTVLALSGQTTTSTQPDMSVIRTGAASALIGQNAGYYAFNTTSNTGYYIQENNGEVIVFTFSGGAWGERCRILPTGEIKYMKALVALGGGAAPTLGTIGGAGPATAAQNSWIQLKDSTGVSVWVPCWK